MLTDRERDRTSSTQPIEKQSQIRRRIFAHVGRLVRTAAATPANPGKTQNHGGTRVSAASMSGRTMQPRIAPIKGPTASPTKHHAPNRFPRESGTANAG